MRAFVLLLLAACVEQPPSNDVVGPFTGERQRFVVDGFRFPMNNSEALSVGRDLDGDNIIDNQFGMVAGTLGQQGTLTTHVDDIIGAGAIASTVEIQADDLGTDARVGVTYFGVNGAPATVVGGRFIDGVFESNRTAESRVPGTAVMYLPFFVDADPSIVELHGIELDLVPDGRGGYEMSIRGGFLGSDVLQATIDGLGQMMRINPRGHRTMQTIFDKNRDGTITVKELATNSLVTSLIASDITLPAVSSAKLLSAGFEVHLTPCPSGRCTAAPNDRCFDRVHDGDETDVDCGGSCRKCVSEQRCVRAQDCDSNACDSGRCRANTCSDGVQDGFESDIDCGMGPGCQLCALGRRCTTTYDCASMACRMGSCTAS